MLIRFAVENFLSFKEMTEFNMAEGKMTRHKSHVANCKGKRVLKGAYVFGANAGGKTNLARAIAFAQNIVVNGVENTNCDKKYFRIDSTYKLKPSVFQFDIFSNGHFYSYGFAISLINGIIEEEWLYQIDDSEKCVFLRSKSEKDNMVFVNSDIRFSTKKEEGRFALYSEDIRNPKMSKTLFLSDVAMRSPEAEEEYRPFRDVVNWISRLTIIFPDSKFDNIIQLIEDNDERTRLENLLQYFDTGIAEVQKKALPFEKAFVDFPEQLTDLIKTDMAKRLKGENHRANIVSNASRFEISYDNDELVAFRVVSNHGNDEDLFEYADESDGTQRLFDLIPVFQRVLDDGVIIIDELDRSLHTKAVQEFINYFYALAEGRNSQLIVTTHDSNIMDLDLIRQDEIWFVERQRDHSSKLYSLNRFMVRFDKKVEKDYLLGRYGAVPVFRQYVLDSRQDEEGDLDGDTNQ